MARPVLPPEKKLREQINVNVTSEELAALDGLRGQLSRSEVIRNLLRSFLGDDK